MEARTPLEPAVLMLELFNVGGVSQAVGIDQAQGERFAVSPFPAVKKLVHERLTAPAAMHQHVLQVHQLLQMRPHHEVRPAGERAHLPPREAVITPRHLLPLALAHDVLIEHDQQAPGLRGELIE